jgi:hypothetical protein
MHFLVLLTAIHVPTPSADQLPPKDVLRAAIQFNRQVHDRLAAVRWVRLERAARIDKLLLDLDALHDLYVCAINARGDGGSYGWAAGWCWGNESKREAIARLRKLIGDDAFYRGVLPEAVPSEYFHEAD